MENKPEGIELSPHIKSIIGSVILAFALVIAIGALADLLRFQIARPIYTLLVLATFILSCYFTTKTLRGSGVDGVIAGLLFGWISILLFQRSLVSNGIKSGSVSSLGLIFIVLPLLYAFLGYVGGKLGTKLQRPRFRFAMERQEMTKRSFKVMDSISQAKVAQIKSTGRPFKIIDPNLRPGDNKINRPKRSFKITDSNSQVDSAQTKSTKRSFKIVDTDSDADNGKNSSNEPHSS